MTRVLLASACAVAIGAAACGRQPSTVLVQEDGCVTASGDQFVLTDLQRGAGDSRLSHKSTGETSTTEAYLLEGRTEDLRALVGRRARVSGEADPAQIAEFRDIVPQGPARSADEPVGTSGVSGDAAGPQVQVSQNVRMEVHRLRVSEVSATGDSCTANAGGASQQ